MSLTSQYRFQKRPTSLPEELSNYQDLAREAEKKGNYKLAARWNFAADLIIGFLEYLHSSRQLSIIKKLIEQTSINDRAVEIQEIAQYTTSSLAALMSHDLALAQQLSIYAEETKEAGIRCRHWLAFLQNEIDTHHTTQELFLDNVATEYRANALTATQAGKNIIAQHWAEAACLAQEASRKKGYSIAAYVTSGNTFLSSSWELSRDASYHAAKLKVKVALALEQGQSALAQEYDNIALLAEKLSVYRENLVNAIIHGEMATIPHWRSAAEFLSKGLEIHQLLLKKNKIEARPSAKPLSDEETEPLNQDEQLENLKIDQSLPEEEQSLVSYQKIVAMTAEQAAERHSELVLKLQKKKKISLISVHFAEHSYQEAMKALLAFQANDLSSSIRTKKRAELYSKASLLSKKAAYAKTQWYTFGIPFLYWRCHLKKVEHALKNES